MSEEWRPVVGWEGAYEVSDHGRVRSVARITMRKDGKPYTVRPRVLCQATVRGYRQVGLVRPSVLLNAKVHRLVMEAFIGPCPTGQQVRHLDGERINNALVNLTYGTAAQNAADRDAHGTTARGERGNAKLTAEQVVRIRALRAEGRTVASLARQFGIGTSQVSRITRGIGWQHVEAA